MCFTSGWLGWGRGCQPPHTPQLFLGQKLAMFVDYIFTVFLDLIQSPIVVGQNCLFDPFCAVHHISFFVPCCVVVPHGCRSPRPRWGSSKPIFLRPNRWFAPWRRRLMSVWSLANAGTAGRHPGAMARNDELLSWILSFGNPLGSARKDEWISHNRMVHFWKSVSFGLPVFSRNDV